MTRGMDMASINAAEFFRSLEDSDEFHFESAKLEFAMELKRAMEREGLNNAQLAERLGVSRPMVTKLLRGDANVTIETMVKAARRLGGKLFIRLVRDGSSARFFEVARSAMARPHYVGHLPAAAKHEAQQGAWYCAANDENENQSLAA
jgi:transcriptional regulator with XRE-family HTH domain